MQLPDAYLLANLLYLMIVAGIWLAALALVTPGTGLIELLAVAALAGGGAGLLLLPANGWAFVALVAGALMFALALTGRRPTAWLVGSALALSAGSVFLFRLEPGGGPAVHPLLAALSTMGTLGFFWLVIRKAAEAQRIGPVFDPAAVLGQVGEARTALDPTGAVYVAGELWSARAAAPLAAGARVRVTKVEGLILEVVPAGPDEGAGASEGGHS